MFGVDSQSKTGVAQSEERCQNKAEVAGSIPAARPTAHQPCEREPAMLNRRPLLCLDTNASIDIGVLHNLDQHGDSLDTLKADADHLLSVVSYDTPLKDTVTKLLQDRHDQLEGTHKFLGLVENRSTMCVPEFVKIEHRRVRPSNPAFPNCDVRKSALDAQSTALDLFAETTLSLQDSLVLASALTMNADALVSNDDDFKKAFREGNVARLAVERAGKPLLLLDHRLPLNGHGQASLHRMLLGSLDQHYDGHLAIGKPRWVDRIPGTPNWYCAYQHPIPPSGDIQRVVPGRHRISIVDGESWVVCDVKSMRFFDEDCPGGITEEFIQKRHASHEDPRHRGWFLPPKGNKPGYVCVSLLLDELPQPWASWKPSSGARTEKRTAPREARGFVESVG